MSHASPRATPLVSYYGNRAEKLTPQERAQAEEKLGLDEPIFPQYVRWRRRPARGFRHLV